MIRNLITCKYCKEYMDIDTNLTVESYKENDFLIIPIQLTNLEPPKIPNYVIFSCNNPTCSYTVRLQHEEVMEAIYSKLANLAWDMYKVEMSKATSFDKYITRYILDKGVNTFINNSDVKMNTIFKEYLKLLKDVKE